MEDQNTEQQDNLADRQSQSGLDSISDALNKAKQNDSVQNKNAIGDLYKGSPKTVLGKTNFLIRNKKAIGGGAAGLGIVGLIFALISTAGFLSVFQLDHLMSNIEIQSFTRHKADLDRRSDQWVKSYMLARLGEMDGDTSHDSVFFRADGTDGRPTFKNWYIKMRGSQFEADIFNKHGIYFTSGFDKNGKPRGAIITLKDESNRKVREIMAADGRDLTGKDFRTLDKNDKAVSKYLSSMADKLEKDFLEDDKIGCKKIKEVVKTNTRWWEVNKRRQLRKYIQRKTGVREWIFFEKTRNKYDEKKNKYDEKKIDVRNKIIKKILPSDSQTGKVIQCLFGILLPSECKGGEDAADSNGDSEKMTEDGSKTKTEDQNITTADRRGENGEIIKGEKKVIPGVAMELIEKALKAAGVGMKIDTIVSWMDMISSAIKALNEAKGMVIALKTAEAIGAFQMLGTMRDQMKTGEVTAFEVSKTMEVMSNISANEGYDTVIAQNKTSNKAKAEDAGLVNAKDKEEFCSEGYQKKLKDPKNVKNINKIYTYNCPEKQIGGVTGAIANIDRFNNSEAGKAISEIANAYSKIRESIIGEVFGSITYVSNWISERLTAPVIHKVLNVLGISDDLEKIMSWAFSKIAQFAGIQPLVDVYEGGELSSGQIINAAIQGGAATAEGNARTAGASKTTKQTMAEANQRVAEYNRSEKNQWSIFYRYASINNPESLFSRGLFIFANQKNNILSIISSIWSNISGSFLPGHFANAASDPYRAANFAGIDTYDYPKQCFDISPMEMTPKTATNIQEVISGVPDSDLTWDLVTDSQAFYDYVYNKLRDGSLGGITDQEITEKAMQIYNCALLDNNVAGGLGALYGYTDDHGLDNNSPDTSSSSSTTTASTPGTIDRTDNGSTVQCDPRTQDTGIQDGYIDGKKIKVRICTLDGNSYLGVNSQISTKVADLIKDAKKDNINLLDGSTGFITMARQTELWNANPNENYVAKPGHSNHQFGLSIDFAYNGSTICFSPRYRPSSVCRAEGNNAGFKWLDKNAKNYGLENYINEGWHWSVGGN